MEIIRSKSLDELYSWKDKHFIKVITGVRRCGKSTLLNQYIRRIIKTDKIDKKQIIFYDFNNPLLSRMNYLALYNEIIKKSCRTKINYVFLDEIQEIAWFEKCVIGLFEHKKIKFDIIITGSNSKMFSQELATLFTGRNIEIHMLPLSFSEYYLFLSHKLQLKPYENSKVYLFDKYLKFGGLPIILESINNNDKTNEILRKLYLEIRDKDIKQRNNIRKNVTEFDKIAQYAFDNNGNKTSFANVSNSILSLNRINVTRQTIAKYYKYLCDSLLIYSNNYYDRRGKRILETSSQFYCVDTGLRNANLRSNINEGKLLENVVFLELLRRKYKVYTVELRNGGEIDFVAENNKEIVYIQVTKKLDSKNIIKREIGNLLSIKDNFKKIVLSREDETNITNDGIVITNIIEWLLNDDQQLS